MDSSSAAGSFCVCAVFFAFVTFLWKFCVRYANLLLKNIDEVFVQHTVFYTLFHLISTDIPCLEIR